MMMAERSKNRESYASPRLGLDRPCTRSLGHSHQCHMCAEQPPAPQLDTWGSWGRRLPLPVCILSLEHEDVPLAICLRNRLRPSRRPRHISKRYLAPAISSYRVASWLTSVRVGSSSDRDCHQKFQPCARSTERLISNAKQAACFRHS